MDLMQSSFPSVQVRDDQMVLNSKILSLQKNWKDHCLRLHKGCQSIDRDSYQLFPHYIGVPVDRERAANRSKVSESVGPQREVIKPSAVSALHANTTTKSISPPSISDQRNEDLVLKLQVRHSKSDEDLQGRGVQPRHENLSNSHDLEDHVPLSSAASVATDLVLGTPRESSPRGTSSTCREHVDDAERSIHLIPNKVDDLNLKPPQLLAQPYSCSRGSTNVGRTSPSALHPAASGGMSAFGQWQRPSHLAAQGSDLSNYKQLMERLFKIVGRQEEALAAICASIVRCRSLERRRGAHSKNDIWFSFHGSDSMAKRRVAAALAELVHGSKENMIYLDLSLQDWDDSSLRRKNGTDYIVEELRNKRRSVIFLDNIDKADGLVHDRVSYVIETGRFQDSRGVEVDIKDSIVVLSTRMTGGCKNISVGVEENHTFSEEKILAARGNQLKIFVEPGTGNTRGGGPGGKVVVSSRNPLQNIHASSYSGSVSKRKLNICDDQEKMEGSANISKRLHRTSSVPFDLNLPVDEDGSDDGSNSDDASSGNRQRSIDSLLSSVDETIDFKPFDFGKLADDMLQELSDILSSILGSDCTMEIDTGAMVQILAAAWASEGKRPVQAWLEKVFARSLDELKRKCGERASSSTLRLVTCDGTVAVKEDDGFGALLPSAIILEC